MEHLKEIPFLDKYPVFRKLAAIGDLRKLTPEERDLYEDDIKIMRDLYATDKWEKKKRRMELEEATQKALAKGMEKGMEKGIEKGETRKSFAIAQNLLTMGLPIAQIMQATGLTKEQINSLKN